MKVESMNIRGLGALQKKKKIQALIKEESLEFMVVQETKMVEIDSQMCEQMWGGVDCA